MKLLISLIVCVTRITAYCFRKLVDYIVQAVREEDWIGVAMYAMIPVLVLAAFLK